MYLKTITLTLYVMIRRFEGIRIFTLNTGMFNRGSAITIPGIGIFLGVKQINNTDLIRHEFGHILQCRQKGALFFWFIIAPLSLFSAFKTSINKNHIHMHTWTEWSANYLSYEYFEQPEDWDVVRFPVHSSE